MTQFRPWVMPWVLGLSTGIWLGGGGLVKTLLVAPVWLATLIVVIVQLRRDASVQSRKQPDVGGR